jgi:dnd system-associated protein 4
MARDRAAIRLRKSAEYEECFQLLGNKPETKFFDSMKDVFMFACTLGFKHDRRLPFTTQGGEPIRLTVFEPDDENIFNIIAISCSDDLSILYEYDECQDKKYRMMEEFANGGMSIMAERFCNPVPNENEFKKFIRSYYDGSDQQAGTSIDDLIGGAIDSLND